MPTNQRKYYDDSRGPDLRRNPDSPNRWVVNDMWDMHHEIARRLVLGQKNVQIAEEMAISPQTVSIVKNSPIVQEHISIMQGARDADTVDLAREIQDIAPTALNLLKNIILGEADGANASIGLRAKTSENMLARVGHGVPHRVENLNANVFLSSQDIEEIKRRALFNENIIDLVEQ